MMDREKKVKLKELIVKVLAGPDPVPEWPPQCIGLFYQPKKPIKKEESKKESVT